MKKINMTVEEFIEAMGGDYFADYKLDEVAKDNYIKNEIDEYYLIHLADGVYTLIYQDDDCHGCPRYFHIHKYPLNKEELKEEIQNINKTIETYKKEIKQLNNGILCLNDIIREKN